MIPIVLQKRCLILLLGIWIFAATSLLHIKPADSEENDVKEETRQGQDLNSEEIKTEHKVTSFSDYINETKPCDDDSDCEKMKCSAMEYSPGFNKPVVERVDPPEVAKCIDKKCACPSAADDGKKFEQFKDFFTNISTKMPDTDFFKVPEIQKQDSGIK